MSFKKILDSEDVKRHLGFHRKWWSDYIYHFSHVTNVASILNDNIIKSREELKSGIPIDYNENASLEVINSSNKNVHKFVRFYFRPLTPTQFNSEGIRSSEEITHLNAHCPVPVFMLFDPNLLENKNTMFSYESLASHYEVKIYSSVDDFRAAPFNHIYHSGAILEGEDTRQIIKRRHAEILVPNCCSLDQLQKIVCRTEAERLTLISLLTEEAKDRYLNKIIILKNENHKRELFFSNKLMVNKVTQSNDETIVEFDTNHSKDHLRSIYVVWLNELGETIAWWGNNDVKTTIRSLVDSGNAVKFTTRINFKNIYNKVQIFIDKNLVFQTEYNKY